MENEFTKIGILINDVYSDYTRELIAGVSDTCKKNNAACYIYPVGELGSNYTPFEYQRRAAAYFATSNNIDGLILASSTQGNHVSQETLSEYMKTFNTIPTVSIGIPIEGIPSIKINSTTGFNSILDDLVMEHHCKKFIVLGVHNNNTEGLERKNCILNYFKAHNIEFNESDYLNGWFTYDSAYTALKEYTQNNDLKKIDAIICLNDDMAFAAIDFLTEQKIRVPDDIIVTGFDDIPGAKYCKPSLTSVNQMIYKQGESAVNTLFKIFNNEEVPAVTKIETEAYFRQSCGCVSKEDSKTDYITKNSVAHLPVFHKDSNISLWISKKSELNRLVYFFYSSQLHTSYQNIRDIFKDTMEYFTIHKAAICIYPIPVKKEDIFYNFEMPNKVSLLAYYDKTADKIHSNNDELITFNPRVSMLPKNLFTNSTGKYYIHILSHKENHYGYFVYESGTYDELCYSLMATMISKLVAAAYNYSLEQKEKEQIREDNKKLAELSTKDELTGLFNRRGFIEFGRQSIDIACKMNHKGLVLYADMDGLKHINDTYGHDAGDRAIKAEAEILKNAFRETDIVSRLGGDEFAIIASGLNEERFMRIKTRIDTCCKEWSALNPDGFELSVSIGCTAFSNEHNDLNELLQTADYYLYEAKKKKKNAKLR